MVQSHVREDGGCTNGEPMENTGDHLAPSGGVWSCMPCSHEGHTMDGHWRGGPGASWTFAGANRFLSLDERSVCLAYHKRTVER